MSLLISSATIDLGKKFEWIQHYALPRNRILVFTNYQDYILWDGLENTVVKRGFFPENIIGICDKYSYWFQMITGEKMIYYSPMYSKLKVFDLFTGKDTETWPQDITINPNFNFCMWLSYNNESKKALFLYMTEKNKYTLESFSKDGKRENLGECTCKPLNIVCEDEGVFYFSHNIGASLVINVASEHGLSSVTFLSPPKERVLSYCFFQEKRILLLFNDKESSKKSGCYLFNLSLYNYTDPLEIRPEECEKIILHDFQSYPASLDGNILVDRMMGQIAVTTNNNKIYAHQLYEQGGKTQGRCIMESQVKEAPNNFSLQKDFLIYADRGLEDNRFNVAFYRSTDIKCLYMWFLKHTPVYQHFTPGELHEAIQMLT